MTNRNATVDAYMDALDHPRKAEIERVRSLILGASEHITERIKWNAPSFCYRGDDRVTLRLHPRGTMQIVFHRGARARSGEDFRFEDPTGLLDWVAQNRAIVTLRDMAEVEAHAERLRTVVPLWMDATT